MCQLHFSVQAQSDINTFTNVVPPPIEDDVLPVGSIYIAIVNTDPAISLGYGTWQAFATGRVLIGVDVTDPNFDQPEKIGGAKAVTLDATQIPAHSHPVVDGGHTHVQNAHTHVQDAHNHIQNSFAPRIINSGTAGTVGVQGASGASNANASNSATTATNQAATAVNQNATAVNQSAATGISLGNTGGGMAHSNIQPSIAVFMLKRVA